MKVIGLCGGSGSGKGIVCLIFSEHGIPSIDTDAVYHQLTSADSACTRKLAAAFGNEILFPDGSLNRQALASIVFSGDDSGEKRARLNEISHKFILDEARKRISSYENKGYSAVIVDAPLLFESGFDSECDLLICVIAEESVRIDRIMTRDSIDYERAMARIASQIKDEILKSKCDIIIENNGDISSLRATVKAVAEQLTCK